MTEEQKQQTRDRIGQRIATLRKLAGMSQEGCATEKKSIPGKDNNHSCGHNLFAAGSLAAALAVKAYIEETGKGTVTLFGCPAEEGGGGKVFMARAGVFSFRETEKDTLPVGVEIAEGGNLPQGVGTVPGEIPD